MGLMARIYAPKYAEGSFGSDMDCTNGGISGRVDKVTIVEIDGKPVDGPFKPKAHAPAVRIVRRSFGGGDVYFHAEPVEPVPDGNVGYMAGGNMIEIEYMLRGAVGGQQAISLHDRSETPEEYRALSI